jgi:AcrR family transcriptional regulator
MGEIAREAGVTKPLIYLHYESKDGLYAACQRAVLEPLVARVREAIARSKPDVAMPLAVADAIFAALEPDRRGWSLLTDRSLPRTGPAAGATRSLREQLAELAVRGSAEVLAAAGLNDTGDVELATRVWVSTCDALIAWWLEHPGETAAAMSGRFRRLVDALALSHRGDAESA